MADMRVKIIIKKLRVWLPATQVLAPQVGLEPTTYRFNSALLHTQDLKSLAFSLRQLTFV